MTHAQEEVFFRNPLLPPNIPGTFGILYLLRRDIAFCFGALPGTSGLALWPGAMAVLAGIDLLGKYQAGKDDVGEVGPRFKAFLTMYMDIPPQDNEVIYQLRNSLLHSFGLYSETKTGIYRFRLGADGAVPLVTHCSDGSYHVDIRTLWLTFETAVDRYRLALTRDLDLQMRFVPMFKKYGAIAIGG